MPILHTRQGSRLRTERDYGTADFVAEYIKLGVIPYVARKKEDRLGDLESHDMAYQLFDSAEGVQAKQGNLRQAEGCGWFCAVRRLIGLKSWWDKRCLALSRKNLRELKRISGWLS